MVMVHDVPTGKRELRGVKAATRRVDWWGSDPVLAKEVEESLGQCEDPALRSLRDLDRSFDQHWPLSNKTRALLAQFIAIHVVRTPGFGAFLRRTTEEIINEQRTLGRASPEEIRDAARKFRADRGHANTLLGQITRIASLLSSMHWAIVRFDKDLLITADQPVIVLPWNYAHHTPSPAVVPVNGYVNTVEIRFPLNPQTLLLMSWQEDDDAPAPVQGTFHQACNVNTSLSRQADKEWCFRPDTIPQLVAPPLLRSPIIPISFELLPNYNFAAARGSQRRRKADELMSEIVEESAPRNIVRWVTLSPTSSRPPHRSARLPSSAFSRGVDLLTGELRTYRRNPFCRKSCENRGRDRLCVGTAVSPVRGVGLPPVRRARADDGVGARQPTRSQVRTQPS